MHKNLDLVPNLKREKCLHRGYPTHTFPLCRVPQTQSLEKELFSFSSPPPPPPPHVRQNALHKHIQLSGKDEGFGQQKTGCAPPPPPSCFLLYVWLCNFNTGLVC